MISRGNVWFIFMMFKAVACEDFQLFVTDYGSEKIYILNATGDVIGDFNVTGPVGMAIDTFGLGDIVVNPTVIYSTYPPDGSAKPIYRSQMNGSSAEILYDSHRHLAYARRLAVDPTSGNVFYTGFVSDHPKASYIAVLTRTGEHVQIITGLSSPRDIVLHPAKGKLFWTDVSIPSVNSANMDGSNPVAMITTDIMLPNGLAIDFNSNTLYWIDEEFKRIEKCSLTGESREVVARFYEDHTIDLLIYGDFLYYNSWSTGNIWRVRLNGSSDYEIFASIPGAKNLYSMSVYSEEITEQTTNENCKRRYGLGDCSNICLPTADGHVCTCDAGRKNLQDRHTCVNATRCTKVIQNGNLVQPCDRFRFERCNVTCIEGALHNVKKEITCDGSKWDDANPCTKCPQLSIPHFGSANDTAVKTGTVVKLSCSLGYTLFGTDLLTCQRNGSWNNELPSCYKDCLTLNIENGSTNTTTSSHDSIVHVECKMGYVLFGEKEIRCTRGLWIPDVPSCHKDSQQIKLCPPNVDYRGTSWKAKPAGVTVLLPCQGADVTGSISRQCSKNGDWLLPLYKCIRPTVKHVQGQVETLKTSFSMTGLAQVLKEIGNVTSPQADGNALYSGELETLTEMLDSLAILTYNHKTTTKYISKRSKNSILEALSVQLTKQKMLPKNKHLVHILLIEPLDDPNRTALCNISLTVTLCKTLLKSASNLIDGINENSWKAVSEQEESLGASGILHSVDKLSVAMANEDNTHDSAGINITETNIAMEINRIQMKDKAISFPRTAHSLENFKTTSLFMDLSEHEASRDIYYAAVVYKSFHGMLPDKVSNNGNHSTSEKQLNTPILSLQFIDQPSIIAKPVRLTFYPTKSDFQQPICVYWSFISNQWQRDGCHIQSYDKSEIVCECDHLTNFAVLMSPWMKENTDTTMIEVISIIGCSISIICLILTVILYVFFWRYLKSDRGVILMNICFALTASYIVFLAGINQTAHKATCTAVAVVLQYVYLTVFCLMLAEGVEVMMTVLYVFVSKRRIKWTIPLAWGVPALIVGISMGATQLKGYGNDQFCWLSVDSGLIWAFVGPALLIILTNAVILVLVLRTMVRSKIFSEKTDAEKIKGSLRCLGVLLPLMGCTWILGIFYVNKHTAWIQYIFAICNGLQGFFIFLFHVCLNKQLHTAVKRKHQLYKDTSSGSQTMSSRTKSTFRKTSVLSSTPMPVLNNVLQVDADRDDHEKAKLNSQQQNETFENGTMSAL